MQQRVAHTRRGQVRVPERLAAGHHVRDLRTGLTGTVLDVVRRYLFAEADPIYNYLIRWEDGLVVAVDENALDGRRDGIEALPAASRR